VKLFEILELSLCVVVRGAQCGAGMLVRDAGYLRTVGVDLRARNAQMNFDAVFPDPSRRRRPAFDGDVASPDSIVHGCQPIPQFSSRRLDGTRSGEVNE